MKVTLVPSVMLMDKFVLGEVRGENNWQPIAVMCKFVYKEQYLILMKQVDKKCRVTFVQVNDVSTPGSVQENPKNLLFKILIQYHKDRQKDNQKCQKVKLQK